MKKLVNGTYINMSPEELAAYQAEDTARQQVRLQTAYKHARAEAYPPMTDYLDAVVKMSSANPTVQAEGEAQLEAYCSACLAVKAQFPKPQQGGA